jgi:hypothetical protein
MIDGKLITHIPTFEPKDLDYKTLQLRVVEDGGITVILGIEYATGNLYVIDVKGDAV